MHNPAESCPRTIPATVGVSAGWMWGLLGLLLGGGGAPEVGDGGGGPAAPHRRSQMEAVGRWRRGEGPSRRGSASGKQRVEGEEWRAVAHRRCVRVWCRSRAQRRTPALHEARAAPPAKFVKVAVDGAPYLRKVNLQDYAGYDQLIRALQDMFCSHFTIRRFGNDETKLVDAVNGTEYMPTYEDKDGDWMLVGDVPWNTARIEIRKIQETIKVSLCLGFKTRD